MTNQQFAAGYRAARDQLQIIEKDVIKGLHQVYIDAGKSVSEAIKAATDAELSTYTINGYNQINTQLRQAANSVASRVEDALPGVIGSSYNNYALNEIKYTFDAFKNFDELGVTIGGLSNVAVRVNERLVEAVFNLQFQDGFNYSQRIWKNLFTVGKRKGLPAGIFGDYQYRIKHLIAAGTAQGRDQLKIAEDLSVYLKDGYKKLAQRYGKLKRGTAAFTKRISNKVDWRALRLVRSVQNSGMQIASIQSALINPAHNGLYDWLKTRGNPIDPNGSKNASGFRCIDLEEFNPYTIDDVPGYQHSNCSCSVLPQVKPRAEFETDVQSFLNGNTHNYVGQWYNNVYLASQ